MHERRPVACIMRSTFSSLLHNPAYERQPRSTTGASDSCGIHTLFVRLPTLLTSLLVPYMAGDSSTLLPTRLCTGVLFPNVGFLGSLAS